VLNALGLFDKILVFSYTFLNNTLHLKGLEMSYGTDTLLNILAIADHDPVMRSVLDSDPASVYIGLGYKILDTDKSEFNQLFRAGTASFMNIQFHALSFLNSRKFKCIACRTATFSLASTIVALGAVGISTLAVTSSVITALASIVGISVTAAKVFLSSLAGSIISQVSKLTEAICKLANICP
tara:strand:- start:976 stop:1524 length:549 start_codon:yes stop_codon:yes gene_type:complete